MSKTIKGGIIGLISAMSFLLAGLFFVGCTYDISNVSVSASANSITLELDGMNESQDLVFTINNAPSGFSNTLKFNVDNEGVVEISSPVTNGNTTTVTVTALAGGTATIMAITEEGYKYTTVQINVIQHSETLEFNNSSLYVSNSTPFVVGDGYYYFDANTTDKNMSFYFFENDITSLTFSAIENNEIIFNSSRYTIGEQAFLFDTAYIEGDNLVVTLNGEEVARTALGSTFNFLAFYDYSSNYTVQLACINEVYILEDLDVEITGGYVTTSSDITFGVIENSEILIAPNTTGSFDASTFILKINIKNNSELVDFDFSRSEIVQIDNYDYSEEGIEGAVYYLKISYNVFNNISDSITVSVKYSQLDMNVQDSSVSFWQTFDIQVIVVPVEILLNGQGASEYSSEDNPLIVYNQYQAPEYGWQELLVSLSAGVNIQPAYSYAYIEFNVSNEELEFQQSATTSSGLEYLASISSGQRITDLSQSFQFRGHRGISADDTVSTFTIYVVCENILDNDGNPYTLSVDVYYKIVNGVTIIERNGNLGQGSTIYLDYVDALSETVILDNYLFADAIFKSISFEFVSGSNVVSFVTFENCCVDAGNSIYFLYFGVNSRAVGTGIYNIILDNGTYITITFTVVNTLKSSSTYIDISETGNIAYYSFESSNNDDFYDVLNLELLNPTELVDGTYTTIFSQTSSISFAGNIQSIDETTGADWNEGVVTYTQINTTMFTFETRANGVTQIQFRVTGYTVNENYQSTTTILIFTVNIVSYSLLTEFYYLNNGTYAVDNVIYYGSNNIPDSDRQVVLTVNASPTESFNFYQYTFTDEFLQTFADYALNSSSATGLSFTIDNTNFSQYLSSSLVQEEYDDKFIFYYVQNNTSNNTSALVTATTVRVVVGGFETEVTLIFENGFMFYVEGIISFTYTTGGNFNASLTFTNQFTIGQIGTFDLTTMTFVSQLSQQSVELVIHAYVRQRNYSRMTYDINISSEIYIAVDDISTAGAIDELIFTNSNLEETFTVYITPQNATNSNLTFEYVPTNEISDSLIEVTIVERVLGTYTVTVSAQRFYDTTDNIDEINDTLAGTLYIYPSEWGENASVILGYTPISIAISYRNGSENNRLILETADDILAIGTNEKTLSSHYEIRNIINLENASTSLITSIGIINGEVIGFSGSIVGTTSQAGIMNVNLTGNTQNVGIYYTTVGSDLYYGLFAQINEGAYIKNLAITGSFGQDIQLTNSNNYVGILTAINYGKISNVSVTISSSCNITPSSQSYIGTLAGVNYGEIVQYFSAYNADYYDSLGDDFYYTIDDVSGEFGFDNQTVKNMAYFEGLLTINATNSGNIYIGGVAGAAHGDIIRQDDTSLSIYGYSNYSAYVNILVTGGNANVYAGGIVGYAYTESILNLNNLIVGGEVDCQYQTASGSSYVGGIVGFATMEGSSELEINIFNNISRVFLRGKEYVGGIIGYDDYINYGNSGGIYYNEFDGGLIISSNSIQAVDDGRSAYDASMIIIYSDADKLNANYDDTIIFAVGNAVDGNRSFYQGLNNTSVDFEAISYINRTLIYNSIVTRNSNYSYTISEISTTHYYADYLVINGDNEILTSETFEFKSVEIGVSAEEDQFRLYSEDGSLYVYLSFYFNADSFISAQNDNLDAQDIVDDLNTFSPDSEFYPFSLETRDAEIISSTTSVVSVDSYGIITTLSEGRATIRLQSILNVQETISIYLYVVNFFNKDVEGSVFYTSNTADAEQVVNNTQINVYGSRQSTIYAVATYDYEGEDWSVSTDGVLRYQNMSIQLAQNTSLQVSVEGTDGSDGNYTKSIINGQQVTFIRKTAGQTNGSADTYNLSAYVATEIDGNTYKKVIGGSNSIEIDVRYLETATSINITSSGASMQTSDSIKETIYITSLNEELIYYRIYLVDDNGETISIVQSRMETQDSITNWTQYVNTYSSDTDLFELYFEYSDSNLFNITLSVNKNSEIYQNREFNDIYGNYVIVFYANELDAEDAVSCSYKFYLSEAEVSNITASNYSNFNDISTSDQTIVPSQYGLLEITIDPIEAEFNTFTISNDDMNYLDGAGVAMFTFVYQTSVNGIVTFIPDSEFGEYSNGVFTFTYDELMTYIDDVNAGIEDKNSHIKYNGVIYLRYLMPSSGVEDSMSIRFNVTVTYTKNNEQREAYTSIDLTTKLSNYAILSFDDKDESDVYYVARGLSYNLTLEYYGFGLSDITITVSDDSIAQITGSNRSYVLSITSDEISYTDDIGRRIVIYVNASRVVDNRTIEYTQEIVVYVMEYVFNYEYTEGVNEDIVSGMSDGVISTAIGNAYSLAIDVWDLMEYDSSNAQVVANVQTFINGLTANTTFSVHNNLTGFTYTLSSGNTIYSDYYIINGLVFTAIRLYEPEQDIYYFIVSGEYAMRNGIYLTGSNNTYEKHEIYSVFSFSIHQQSTDESPLPIESYEDFLAMEDGEYYILLTDIVLPNQDDITYDQFSPITANIAGFDGNGYTILMGGSYYYDSSVQNFGVFENIGGNNTSAVFKNISIEIYANMSVVLEASSFNIGLLATTNNAIVTNCSVTTTNNSTLSVTYTNSVSSAYVAGLVGLNTGIITNSMTSVDIITNVNLSGFVNSNSGTISSSAFRGGSLVNDTNSATEYTAGFVLQNSGEIYTSYVSGVEDDTVDAVFYQGSDDYIQSDNTVAGFVFTNSGYIGDCYTNINIQTTGSYSAGFVFTNEENGEIRTSFSLSTLSSNDTFSFGFARSNTGYIWDCYYLSQRAGIYNLTNVNGVVNNNISITVQNDVNIATSDLYTDPTRHNVQAISLQDFIICDEGDFEEYFANYAYTDNRNYNSVWFYNNENRTSDYNGKSFNLYRLELVAPNITAFSQRYLYSTEEVTDETTGLTTVVYNYVNTEEAGVTGSVYNPILLDSADHFEEYILNENDNNNYNYSYYRIINNIDYSEYTGSGNSNLYTTKFLGYIEGNFLTVSGIHMVVSSSMQFAGLFAEVGSLTRSDAIGTLLNFNYDPDEVVFTNTQVVGGVAGVLYSGTIVNVNLVSEDIMITGRNIVGGIVGMALGSYTIENVNSSLSARATYFVASETNNFNSAISVYSYYSFAGGIVGVASGSGTLKHLTVDTGISVIGAKAGGLIGLIDQSVTATDLNLDVDEEFMINAFDYGGLVVGETKGAVSDVTVNGTDEAMSIFSKLPNIPTAVGGFAGIIGGGVLDNISITQSLTLSTETSLTGIENVGGLAGIVNGDTTITNIDIDADFVGFSVIGGVIGLITGDFVSVDMTNINYSGSISILATSLSEAVAGGVIGFVDGQVYISLTATLSDEAVSDLVDYYGNYDEVSLSISQATIDRDFPIDANGQILESYRNSANNINVDATILLYVYNTNTIIHFGEIIGQMDSGTAMVYNTISISSLNAQVYDMVSSDREIVSSTITIAEVSYEETVNDVTYNGYAYSNTITGAFLARNTLFDGDYVKNSSAGNYQADTSTITSVSPVYYQEITFSYYNDSTSSYNLSINNVGTCAGATFFGLDV